MSTDPNGWLMSGGVGSAKFDAHGDSVAQHGPGSIGHVFLSAAGDSVAHGVSDAQNGQGSIGSDIEKRHRQQSFVLAADGDTHEIVEIFDNASYGGQLAIAGMVDADFCLPSAPYPALWLSGRFQIGIIDYVWGSGHTVTWDGAVTVDLTNGQAVDAPGYSFNDTCDFAIDWFRFRMVARAELPKGKLWHAERAIPVAKAA